MTLERMAVLILVVAVLGLAVLPRSDSAAATAGALSGVTGAIDAKGNATVWVFGPDRSIRVCSALIPAAAEQRPTCSKAAALP